MWHTGTGDDGETSLIGGARIAKDSPYAEAVGSLDEAMSALGLARAAVVRAASKPLLLRLQRELSLLMTELASAEPECLPRRITARSVAALEADIASLQGEMSAFEGFVVPGDVPGSAFLDFARAVVRRAERRLVALVRCGGLANGEAVIYVNRLSSLLFVLARVEDRAAGVERPTLVEDSA